MSDSEQKCPKCGGPIEIRTRVAKGRKNHPRPAELVDFRHHDQYNCLRTQLASARAAGNEAAELLEAMVITRSVIMPPPPNIEDRIEELIAILRGETPASAPRAESIEAFNAGRKTIRENEEE